MNPFQIQFLGWRFLVTSGRMSRGNETGVAAQGTFFGSTIPNGYIYIYEKKHLKPVANGYS